MSFGTELRDQLPEINQYTTNGIQFLQDFRDFLKERATIEQQYSQAMDKLTKSSIKKFKKSGQSFYGAGNPFNIPSQDFEALGTCAQAFLSLLQETEGMAKSRASLAESFGNEVLNLVKFEIKRKEDARQKHMAFADQVTKAFDAQKSETSTMRNNYRSTGKELDSAFAKYDKAADDKAAERAAKEWNDVLVEKIDRRNEYLISLGALNSHKKTYYFTEMPILMDHLQDLNEHIILKAREIMTDYIGLENNFIAELQTSNARIIQSLEQVNGPQDSALFMQHVKKPWTEPPNFVFEPYSDGEMGELATSPSQVFLLNTLLKLMGDSETLQKEIAAQNKANEGLKNLHDAYVKDPKLGDPIEVWQNVIEGERSFLSKENQRIKCGVQMESIRAAVGSIELINHQLKPASSGICVVCNASMSLFSKGFSCTACPIKFHGKCQMKVAPLCGVEFQTPVPRLPTSSGSSLTRKNTATGSMYSLSSPSPSPSLSPSPSSFGSSAPSSASQGKARVLYQYDAQNDGDLSVMEGDILDVVEFDDGNGWLTGTLNGVTGVIPANYVEKITPSKPSSLHIPSNNTSAAPSPRVDKVRAIYDYQAQAEIELSISVGDIIEVTNRNIEPGWWEGRLNGRMGQFPENYVEPA